MYFIYLYQHQIWWPKDEFTAMFTCSPSGRLVSLMSIMFPVLEPWPAVMSILSCHHVTPHPLTLVASPTGQGPLHGLGQHKSETGGPSGWCGPQLSAHPLHQSLGCWPRQWKVSLFSPWLTFIANQPCNSVYFWCVFYSIFSVSVIQFSWYIFLLLWTCQGKVTQF